MTDNETKLRTITGKVVSNKMDKTITVLVERVIKHPVYGKYLRSTRKYHVHDELNKYKAGDQVNFVSCRPYSKMKAWKVVEG